MGFPMSFGSAPNLKSLKERPESDIPRPFETSKHKGSSKVRVEALAVGVVAGTPALAKARIKSI